MSAIASRWKQLPIAASFLVVCGVVIVGAIYTVSYRQRESYLTGRNFRLLAVLAQQTESAIDGYSHTRTATLGQSALPTATQIDLTDGQSRLTLVFGTGKKRTIDSQKIGHILRPVFKTKIGQGAFDTLALAEPSGKLVLAVGRREWEMSSMTLSALLPDRKVADGPPASEPGTPRNAAVAGGSPSPATSRAPANAPAISFERITVLDAVVAGVPYKMFIQPCCELVTQPSPGPAGAVVVGLVPSTALRDEAMAISPTLVVITILLIVLAGLAWPFLNVALQGHRKRITRWDAFQLGFSGTVGLAIATILAITSLQCGRLERDLGRQLADLAAELDAGLSKEIDESTKTLDALAKWLAACPRSSAPVGYVVDEGCKRKGAANPGDEAVKKLDNYDFVSLIDSEGQQQMKARPSQREPPLVNVSERWYFQNAIRYAREPTMWATLGETASITCFGPPCVLDSVVSYTTGKPSAVLARPSGDRSLPVAALTLPMRSVIDPVLPPGFEFAIIDKHGRVVFHSDLQRNAFENLFLETDRNPQLRGLVATGVDGPVTMEYWGRPYIAHVKHARAYGWSIVTLFNRRDLRALMLEWTMVSIMLLAAYALLWAATLGLVVARGASWLWPDRFRRRRYALLNVFYLSLLVAFGLWATSSLFDRSAMAIAGFLVPLVACGAGALVLKHQPAARVGTARLEYRCDYCIPATLLLIVIGILPGASFVARSYDVHVEAYVKHRQLGLVQGLLAPPPAEDDTERGDLGTPRRSANAFKRWYSQFLDRTSICRESVDGDTDAAHESGLESFGACAITRNADEAADPGHGKGRDPFGLLEAYLPYFSEMSVKIRELVHPRADDGSWTSERSKGMTILRVPQPGATPQRVVTASTALPPLINGEGGPLLVMALILVAMAYGIAYFIARYVFLGQVSAPLWALGRLAIPEGRPVILLCDPAVMTPRIHGAAHMPLEPLLRSDDPRAGLTQALERLGGDRHHGRLILVTDLDSGESGLEGVAVKAKLLASLAVSHRRAVMALSKRALPELAAALEAEHPRSRAVRTLARARVDLEKARAIVLDWRAHPGAVAGPVMLTSDSGMRGWWRALMAAGLRQPGGARPSSQARHNREPVGEPLLRAEERAHPKLQTVCGSVRRIDAFCEDRMSNSEILEEVQEGAEELYAELWKQCSDDEKLELRHIAQFGLANPGNGRAVRQLIAKRLVSKDPNLRLMNRTFRRFVLSSQSLGHLPQLDVARIEGELAPSGLDRFRAATAITVAGATAFLFLTQRDTNNATVGAVVALTTQLPNILKVVTMLVQKDTAGAPVQRNA